MKIYLQGIEKEKITFNMYCPICECSFSEKLDEVIISNNEYGEIIIETVCPNCEQKVFLNQTRTRENQYMCKSYSSNR